MQVLLLILFTIVAISSSCQQPVERQTPDWDQTESQTTMPGTTPDTTPDITLDTTPANVGSDSTTNASYNDYVEYFAANDGGKFARVKVEVEESNNPERLDLQIAFTALREINTKIVRRPGTNQANRVTTVTHYPQLLVTLPASYYMVGTHTNDQHYQQLPTSTDTSGNYHIKLNKMSKNNSFRLKLEVLKSALTNGQLNTSFNLQFDSPHFDQVQFKSNNDETPGDGSFPLE